MLNIENKAGIHPMETWVALTKELKRDMCQEETLFSSIVLVTVEVRKRATINIPENSKTVITTRDNIFSIFKSILILSNNAMPNR